MAKQEGPPHSQNNGCPSTVSFRRQGEPELIPWAARVAAGRLPTAFRRAPASAAAGDESAEQAASRANAEWAHSCSLLLAVRWSVRVALRAWLLLT